MATTKVDSIKPTAPISIATPCRDSMTFTSTKGLLNGPGQNNCFLNSAVQVLWHLDIFRRSFRDLSGHACMAESCIFCALKELFTQLQSSPETALPPDALRRALADTFLDQNRFQLGAMDDAAECFENMLLRVHAHVAPHEAEDACAARHCVPHRKFAMTLVEQARCGRCGAASDPLAYTQMVHYVSTSTLVYQVRANSGRPNQDTFGQLLQKAGSMGDVRTCPGSCGAVIQIGRTLTNHPEIVSVGLVWNSERPSLEHIMEVFSTIGTTLRLGDVFNIAKENRWTDVTMHNLVGVVTYYGKHYSTFFFHTKLRVWIYFDDATVREVGPRWEQVVDKCRKGRYQPLLLLYASPDGTPVNTENAPKQITPFCTNKSSNNPQAQGVIRRAVTPSPEKPIIGTTRRAITPNPENSPLNQKPPLPRPYNEYQNLSVIQKNIYPNPLQQEVGVDAVDGCINKREPDYVTRKSLDFAKPGKINVHRTLSNGSSSGIEGMCIPDHMNVPRRRDSGNWSGDRNSASSASSTTMENPYLYLVGKVPHSGGSVPSSPTRIKSDSSSGSSGVYDAGYDSYSLSSNDSSSMSTLQHLMKMGHLAKIPEDYNASSTNHNSQSCDILCDEADELLVKSRQLEDEHDLVLALALCNAAATKARAAMNAPYNNPQTLTLARMKHNTCIMRARSLHRRMTQNQNLLNKDNPPEIRHTREGSSSSGRHSRQNSKDKGQHSRQNSRELLIQEKEKQKPTKNIEIYATLPKKKDALKNKLNAISIEDEEYMIYDKPPGTRESRSIFSRSKNKDQKVKEKRSRSEDRNKLSRDFSIAPEIIACKDSVKKAKEVKDKDEKDGKTKKQHKIRRKLLMGGLIKRKNRSMPDLTEANADNNRLKSPSSTVDDSNVGLKTNTEKPNGMCGYLSEGHLEFTGSTTNPNLERSKLMRKSFHGSAGKILTAAKVPPPPPLRTTSQLSKTKLNGGEVSEENGERSKYPLPDEINQYQNTQQFSFNVNSPHYTEQAPVSLPYFHNNSSYDDDSFYNTGNNTVVTRADIHHEQSPLKAPSVNNDSGVDEVDCLPSHLPQSLELPPYPSPVGSAIHSRQASEEFPPPPPPLDLSALDEHLPKPAQPPSPPPSSYLLSQLQHKRNQIMSQENNCSQLSKGNPSSVKSTGDTWLKELQAKQAALKMKKSEIVDNGVDEVNTQRYLPGENKANSVKDLASKFESSETALYQKRPVNPPAVPERTCTEIKPDLNQNGVLSLKRREESDVIGPEQIAEELREVEMLNAAMNKPLNSNNFNEATAEENQRNKFGKKKSVSFCDQVILVATAEEQEDDSYIPNPILERVLRSAVNKSDVAAVRQEIQNLRDSEAKNQENTSISKEADEIPVQPLYVRRNSLENLLSRQNPQETGVLQEVYSMQDSNYKPAIPANNYPMPNVDAHNYPGNQSPHCFNSSAPCVQNNYYPQNGQYNQNYNVHQNAPNNRTIPVQNQYVKQSDIVQQNIRQNQQNGYPPNILVQPQYPQNLNGEPVYQQQNPQYAAAPFVDSNTYARQSPYQPIPPNSTAYVAYYRQNGLVNNSPQNREYNAQGPYSSSPRYQQMQNIRQSTPSPMGYTNGAYMHPPSPAPSSVSSNYNYIQNMYRGPPNPNFENTERITYQRAPLPGEYPQNYPRPQNEYDVQTGIAYQRVPQPQQFQERPDPYQRVPLPHGEQDAHMQQQISNGKYSPYQHIMPPKQILKKTVSFEPGTKGGCESPTPKAVVTPIIVNNANNSVPTDKTKCNLCRKKNVVAANLYCTDCEFYMSRFKPRS